MSKTHRMSVRVGGIANLELKVPDKSKPASRKRKAKKHLPRFKRGDPVAFKLGCYEIEGVIEEDRGPIGVDGRRLYRIGPTNIELPACDLTRLSKRLSRDSSRWVYHVNLTHSEMRVLNHALELTLEHTQGEFSVPMIRELSDKLLSTRPQEQEE